MLEAFFGDISVVGVVIICGLVFLAGYVDAIAGGGGLISLPAYMIAGLPIHAAIATNKLSSAMGTIVSTWHYARSGFIQLRLAIPCVLCALVGGSLGAQLVLLIDADILQILMLIILPLTAFYVFKSKNFQQTDKDSYPLKKTLIIAMGCALIIGAYDGFYGPGTGTFLILLLSGVAHLRLDAAAGITKVINLTTNLSSLFVFLLNGQVLILIGLLAGCFSIAGNFLGARTFTKSGGSVARPIIIVVLCVFFVKVIYDLASPYFL